MRYSLRSVDRTRDIAIASGVSRNTPCFAYLARPSNRPASKRAHFVSREHGRVEENKQNGGTAAKTWTSGLFATIFGNRRATRRWPLESRCPWHRSCIAAEATSPQSWRWPLQKPAGTQKAEAKVIRWTRKCYVKVHLNLWDKFVCSENRNDVEWITLRVQYSIRTDSAHRFKE